jgi:alginate O-acetyltransferase complex protein AlgI
MMGLKFVENFNFPYIAQSIGDFWRRWHISLSSWFRDFVFYPLERRRLKWIGRPLNTLVVFLLVGLWHGLSSGFIIWGLIHGLALVFESTALGKWFLHLRLPMRRLYVLCVVLLGWVFFRSPTPAFAIHFLRRLLGDTAGVRALPFDLTSPLPFIEPTFILALLVGLVLSLPVGLWLQRAIQRALRNRPVYQIFTQVLYDACMAFLFIACSAATASSRFQPSIYGNF